MKNRRSRLLIEPRFQMRMIVRLGGWALLSTAVTTAITALFLLWADRRSPGDFFFTLQQAGSHPEILSRTRIILPALLASFAANLFLTVLFALYYSSRLAGPIHRLIGEMLKIERGEPVRSIFHLRDDDELKDLAMAFDALLKRLEEKGVLKAKE